MIQQQSLLNVSDNSGAKTAKCIKVLGGFKKKVGHIGTIVTVSIKELRSNINQKNLKIKKGDIFKGVIVRTKKNVKNENQIFSYFNDNAIVLLNKQNNPIATRIIGPISKKLKTNKIKLNSISNNFI